MARCGCNSAGGCSCSITAGTNVSISGVGSAANPYVINATSATAAGCGLQGTGTAVNPIRVKAGTWPYTCPQTNGSVISCGADGVIRGDAPYHTYQQVQNLTRTYASLVVPLADTTLDSADFTFQNPDTCRTMNLNLWVETDVDVTLTAGSQVEIGHLGDNRWAYANNGTGTVTSMHTQVSSFRQQATAVNPGASVTTNIPVNGLRGTAGTTYTRIQWVVRSLWLPS